MFPDGWKMIQSNPVRRFGLQGGLLALVAFSVSIGMFIHVDEPFGIPVFRIALSDLILPLGLIVVLASGSFRELYGAWALSHVPLLLVLLTLVMTFGLLRGWAALGYLSQWALLNKFTGWFVLVAYFALGTVVARGRQADSAARPFKFILVAFLLVSIPPLFTAVPGESGAFLFSYFWEAGRQRGFLFNPNAYGVAAIVAIAILLPYLKYARTGWKVALLFPIFIACWCALLLSASRTMVFAGIFLVACMPLPSGMPWKRYIAIMLGLAVVTSIMWATFPVVQRSTKMLAFTGGEVPAPQTMQDRRMLFAYNSEKHRDQISQSALQEFRESPLFGIGLGVHLERDRIAFQARQASADGTQLYEPVAIHNTGLWLAAEFGLIGLGFFAAAFIYVFAGLWKRARGQTHTTTSEQMLFVLAGCAVASLGMDVLYLRPLWFLLGAACVLPVSEERVKV